MNLFGGGNLFEMMQQIQGMKGRILEMKATLQAMELTTQNADGSIKIVTSGDGIVKQILVSDEFRLNATNTDFHQQLSEVLNRAITTAKTEAFEKLREAAGPLGSMLGDLGLQ